MLPTLLMGLVLLGEIPDGALAPADLASYQAARKDVGRDPEAHIRLALWCEAHGLKAERIKHLALAVVIEPGNALARGLMGLASYRGSWQRPDAVLETVKADAELTARLAEYHARRVEMPDTADGHWKMAVWCEGSGLEAEARAHFTTVTRLDPGRDAAWLRLGCKKHGGRWVTEAQRAAEIAEDAAQKKADQAWRPLLVKWRGWLGDRSRRSQAEDALNALSDPRAARSVWEVFGREGERNQRWAIPILGRLDNQASSSALALLATWGASPEVRRLAAEVLRNRDPREYVGFLLALQHKEFRLVPGIVPVDAEHLHRTLTIEGDHLRFRPELDSVVQDPHGADASIHVEFQEPIWNPRRFFTDDVPFNTPAGEWNSYASAWPGSLGGPMATPGSADMVQQMVARPQDAAAIVSDFQASGHHGHAAHGVGVHQASPDQQIGRFIQRWMAIARYRDAEVLWARTSPMNESRNFTHHVAYFEGVNREIRETNTAIYASLNRITGQDLPEDREAWRKWYYDAQGYAYTPPKEKPARPRMVVFLSLPSCFAAGTPVRTLHGLRPIEEVAVGDQVLAQDPGTGKLSFESVNAVHHNPPGETLRLSLGGEEILPSIYHRFWCAGRGWVMARDLKAGDQVRTLGGVLPVDSVSPGGVQKVYILYAANSGTSPNI